MFDAVEKGLYWLASFVLEGDSDAHCQLRAPLSETVMVTVNDDLMTVIEIRGSRKLIGATEFEVMAANLGTKLASVMKSGNGRQHSFAVGFRSSPHSATRMLREIVTPSMNTAKRLGLNDTAYFDDQVKALAKRCSEESTYLVVYTHRAGLSPSDQKRASAWREESGAKFSKASPASRTDDSYTQSPRGPIPGLVPRHAAALQNLIIDLEMDVSKGGVGLLVQELDVGRAMLAIRRHLDASEFAATWRPRMIGSKGAVLPSPAKRAREATDMFPIRLGRQMVTQSAVEIFGDAEIAKRGSIYYASLVLEVLPEEGSLPFGLLTERIGRQIPWTVNTEIVASGEKLRAIDQFFCGFMGAFGDYNRRVKDGWKELKAMKNAGVYVAGMRVTFTTWADSENEVVEHLSFLRSALESWGSATVTNETGSPGLSTLCSAAGFSKRMPAQYIAAPAVEAARMLSMFRPASAWDSGQLITHTKEGRVYPVGFGTTLQNYWGTLIFAPTGSGKSFLMNMINFGILTSPGLEELPYLTVVDVGPSSRLVMDLVRAMLPARLARQVVSLRIRNSPEYSVNPFDTQHGCDRPTEVDKDFQVATVSILCPTLGAEGERFIGQVISEAYQMLGRASPAQRTWQNTFDKKVSAALEEIGFLTDERTRVWQVVDALFAAGRVEDSSLAQRYAVPKLSDLIKASRAKEILGSYGEAPALNGEKMIDVFTRNIQSALTEYELIAGFTQFEVGSARAISIDLEEVVTGTDSEEGKRRAALMFMFGRRLGAKNYFLRWDELSGLVPDMYREYQMERVARLEESLKFLEYDEVHYASGIPSMSRRMQEDLRVGRKYKCVTMMASQLLQDFPPAAVENCFTYLILGTGTDTALEKLQNTFGLTNSEAHAIQTECTAPGRLFGLFKTVKGSTSQVLHSTAGPFMAWAFSTSKDDALLRTGVTNAMSGDYLGALRALASLYAKGSARDAMEQYKRAKGETSSGETVTEVFTRKVLDHVAKQASVETA